MREDNGRIDIIPIGSGSTGNCIYIELGRSCFLVDMGIGYRRVRDALERNGRSMDDIDAVFLTHGHGDHVNGAVPVCNHTDCSVFGHSSVFYPVRNVKAEKISLPVDEEVEIMDDLRVRMFPVPHDYAYTFGYVFESHNKKLAYVTDCGKMDDRIMKQMEKADLVVIESNHDVEMLKNGPYPRYLQKRILSSHGHLSNDDCARTVRHLYETGCRCFLLAHLSLQNNTPEKALECVRNMVPYDDAFICALSDKGDELLEL